MAVSCNRRARLETGADRRRPAKTLASGFSGQSGVRQGCARAWSTVTGALGSGLPD